MKNIEIISIWDKGEVKQANILKAYATNLELNKSANFWYGLYTESMELVASGSLTLYGDDYQTWNDDEIVWEFIATKLNLVIIGDYVAPEPIVDPVIENKNI